MTKALPTPISASEIRRRLQAGLASEAGSWPEAVRERLIDDIVSITALDAAEAELHRADVATSLDPAWRSRLAPDPLDVALLDEDDLPARIAGARHTRLAIDELVGRLSTFLGPFLDARTARSLAATCTTFRTAVDRQLAVLTHNAMPALGKKGSLARARWQADALAIAHRALTSAGISPIRAESAALLVERIYQALGLAPTEHAEAASIARGARRSQSR